jgi:thiol-disulfide isomerase/thioredoxin
LRYICDVKLKTNLILSIVLALIVTYFVVDRTRKTKAPALPPLKDLHGTAFDPKKLERKVYIMSYFQTWCSDCAKEQPQLQKLQEHFGKDKLEVLMISDEPVEKIDAFRHFFNSGLDFYQSSMALKSREVGVEKFPTTYLVGKQGHVEEVKVEGINWYNEKILKLVGKLIND